MKKIIVAALPFVVIPIFLPVYRILDSLFLVDVFGCGCVPSTQSNMLGIPFNANDLRVVVFSALAIALSVWSLRIAKGFQRKSVKILYCCAVTAANVAFAIWAAKAYMWA